MNSPYTNALRYSVSSQRIRRLSSRGYRNLAALESERLNDEFPAEYVSETDKDNEKEIE
jgi:hypothetical protein